VGAAAAGAPPVATVADPARGGVAAAWGAAPGEVFVVRPDGLLLARGQVADLAELPARLAAGRAAPTGVLDTRDPGAALPAVQARREAAWLAVSDGINSVPADDREGFLARVVLQLGDRIDTEDLLAALSTAAATR
jgi:3-(3-hydroxy-phenyl)propionate hydroxylase